MKRALLWVSLVLVGGLLCLAMLGWQRDLDPADLQAKYANSDSQFIDVGGGVMMHARVEGLSNGPTIVLLHGANSSLQTWEPIVARLGAKYRVITMDLMGNGLTGPNPARDYGAAAHVHSIEALMRQLKVERFILGGASFGGWIAWHYALAHPEQVEALVLIDALGAPGVEPSERSPYALLTGNALTRRIALNITPRSMIASTVRYNFGRPELVTDEMIDRYWELIRYPGNRQATIDRRDLGLPEPAKRAELARLKVPTLIIWGEADRRFGIAAAKWYADAIPGARLSLYPGIGHVPMEEAPDRTAADIDSFMAALAPPSQK